MPLDLHESATHHPSAPPPHHQETKVNRGPPPPSPTRLATQASRPTGKKPAEAQCSQHAARQRHHGPKHARNARIVRGTTPSKDTPHQAGNRQGERWVQPPKSPSPVEEPLLERKALQLRLPFFRMTVSESDSLLFKIWPRNQFYLL